MNIPEAVLPHRRFRVALKLSPEARRRLRWIDYYLQHDRNVSQTCRHFDIGRETFYRWWRRYDPRRLVLPPPSPGLNGNAERAHRTHQEEFYEIVEVPEDLVAHNALLREHEAVYNRVRPHQALGYLTPGEFVMQWRAHSPCGGKCVASTEAVHPVAR